MYASVSTSPVRQCWTTQGTRPRSSKAISESSTWASLGGDARPETDPLALMTDPGVERQTGTGRTIVAKLPAQLLVVGQPPGVDLELPAGELDGVGAEEQLQQTGVA